MISAKIQLCSWLVSFVIGFSYYFALIIYCKLTSKIRRSVRLITNLIFISLLVLICICIYYKITNGLIHYTFLIFWILGFYVNNRVNFYIKRHKK